MTQIGDIGSVINDWIESIKEKNSTQQKEMNKSNIESLFEEISEKMPDTKVTDKDLDEAFKRSKNNEISKGNNEPLFEKPDTKITDKELDEAFKKIREELVKIKAGADKETGAQIEAILKALDNAETRIQKEELFKALDNTLKKKEGQ